MSLAQRPFDQGLQLERTALSWRRTVLALAAAAFAGAKVLFGPLGYAAVIVGGAGLVLALLLYVLSGRRYLREHRRLTRTGEGHAPLPGAGTLALCSAMVAVAGVLALTYVLMAAIS